MQGMLGDDRITLKEYWQPVPVPRDNRRARSARFIISNITYLQLQLSYLQYIHLSERKKINYCIVRCKYLQFDWSVGCTVKTGVLW